MLNGIFRKSSPLTEVKQQVYADMLASDTDSEEYKNLFSHLEKLAVIEAAEGRNHVSPDTMAIVGANILGILIIVGYEQAHVATSRALSFLLRTKSM